MNRKIYYLLSLGTLVLLLCFSFTKTQEKPPNVLFIMMDDLGYGHFGVYNDTITTSHYDSYFVSLVDSLQGYSLDKALEFSKTAIPTLSSLANEGVIFTKAFTSSNICAPSRLGIATGTIQNKFGVYTNVDCEAQGITPGTHLAEKLQNLNYKTAHIGKWHIGKRNIQVIKDILISNGLDENSNVNRLRKSHPNVYKKIKNSGYLGSVIPAHNPVNNGFDYYYGYNYWASQFYNSNIVWENFKHAGKQKGYNTDVFTDKALEVMDDAIKEEKPFYVQLHYHAVHDSLEPKAPEKYFSKFKSDSYDLNNFYAHLNAVDSNVDRIVNYLKSKEEYKNTVIVFTSDNGAMAGGSYEGHKTGSPLPANTPFSGHKGTLFQGGVRVPMFVHWPDGVKRSRVNNVLVSTMDIIPTAIDVAGGRIPQNIDGKSLLPVLRSDKEIFIHDHLLWSGLHAYKWGYLINKSTKNHSTESRFAPPAWVVIKEDYLLRYTGIIEEGVYLEHLEGREPIIELFNIKNDPAELNNLASHYPDKVKELTAIYFEDSKSFLPPVNWKKSKWEEITR